MTAVPTCCAHVCHARCHSRSGTDLGAWTARRSTGYLVMNSEIMDARCTERNMCRAHGTFWQLHGHDSDERQSSNTLNVQDSFGASSDDSSAIVLLAPCSQLACAANGGLMLPPTACSRARATRGAGVSASNSCDCSVQCPAATRALGLQIVRAHSWPRWRLRPRCAAILVRTRLEAEPVSVRCTSSTCRRRGRAAKLGFSVPAGYVRLGPGQGLL